MTIAQPIVKRIFATLLQGGFPYSGTHGYPVRTRGEALGPRDLGRPRYDGGIYGRIARRSHNLGGSLQSHGIDTNNQLQMG
jgi:hypothetical protein